LRSSAAAERRALAANGLTSSLVILSDELAITHPLRVIAIPIMSSPDDGYRKIDPDCMSLPI